MIGTARRIASEVRSRRISAREVTAAALARVREWEPAIHAFLEVLEESAHAAAARIDRDLDAGRDPGPLAGVPVAIKDNLCTGPDLSRPGDGLGPGGRTTAGSRFLEQYRSPFTGTAVRRLLEAGAVVLGKTNLDEFGMGSSTEHSAFGPTRNPWDVSRVPGGSSGGSAAAVAARICPLALGTDTGGSIRQPAGLCGVVGVKPTYGRVSRWGVVAYASSLDQVGPFATDVADAALALRVIAGHDPRDATSAPGPTPDFTAALETPLPNLTLGVPRQARSAANHPGVSAAFEAALEAAGAAGARLVDLDLPLLDHAIAAYYIVAPAEASSNLARYDGVRFGRRAELGPDGSLADLYARSRGEGFGPEVRRRILLGTHVLSAGYAEAYYVTALKARRRLLEEFRRAFAGGGPGGGACDAILLPSSPGPAFPLGTKTTDPLALYLEDIYTVSVNLAGLPALTIPAGFAVDAGSRLPVGLQVIAPAFDDHALLRIACVLERALGPAPPPSFPCSPPPPPPHAPPSASLVDSRASAPWSGPAGSAGPRGAGAPSRH